MALTTGDKFSYRKAPIMRTRKAVGSTGGGRISNYRVTAVRHDGAVNYATVWPRLQSGAGQLLLFTTSK